jgi:hypothetical protein
VGGGPIAHIRSGDHHAWQQAEGVDHNVPLASVDQLAVVEATAAGANHGIRLNRLRINHPSRRQGIASCPLPDLPAQPVMELPDQVVVAPVAGERLNPVTRWELAVLTQGIVGRFPNR